ncbi:hypothetical protein DV736_g420, partial [Chaetothyriales sp. CBS 134916]
MTVSERERERELGLAQFPADNLVVPKSFYPSEVPVKHHQLRHLVSVTRGDQAFYVDNCDIYVLDLQSRQRCLLATVPFETRCLAADHGWVCVGGESKGDCAFIRLETSNGMPTCFGHDLDVQVLGGDIVNSMNIHLLRESTEAEAEPVVLISNNDHTVKIYSLIQREVLATLEHVKPMNYAAISPDSTILAAVGDSDRVYFYERCKLAGGDDLPYPEFSWRLLAVPTVPTGPDVYDDYAFAVSFSPSGRLCAASSQGGAITVFDMDVLLNGDSEPKEAILCTFRSSRPTIWGCVRSMVFSPPPWDLLAWAEDHGRIGVADVRQSFIRRQTVYLDRSKANLIDVQDSTPSSLKNLSIKEKLKEQHLARLRSMQEAVPGLNRSNSLLSTTRSELDQAMRRRQDLRQDLISYHQGLGLDARERSVLEALETPMDDVEHGTQPYSVNYTSSPYLRLSQTADFAGIANGDDSISYNTPSVEPWDIIQSALESARQTDTSRSAPTNQPVTLAQIEAALDAERALGDQLERRLSDERQLSDLLRRQLETQEQFLLHRDLRSEQQFGEQRSQDLEIEMRLGNNRALRLYLERARLLQAATGSAQAAPSPQAHEAHRRERQAWIENLERQVRRAESRVAVAAAEIRTLQAALQRNDLSERDREAHLMFIRSAGLRDADSNGNWVGSGQLFMIYNQGRAATADSYPATAATRTSRPGDPADMSREMEIGTTGIAWSADGRRLFCGTEQGIFEYTVNIKDRMQFPSLELR